MCKFCVDDGLMTVQQLDDAILAGDQSVIPYADRIAAGQSPSDLIAQFLDALSPDQVATVMAMSDDEIIDLLSGKRRYQ